MKKQTECTQAPLGFLPLGCLNKNGHVTHAKHLGKTKRSQSLDDAILVAYIKNGLVPQKNC